MEGGNIELLSARALADQRFADSARDVILAAVDEMKQGRSAVEVDLVIVWCLLRGPRMAAHYLLEKHLDVDTAELERRVADRLSKPVQQDEHKATDAMHALVSFVEQCKQEALANDLDGVTNDILLQTLCRTGGSILNEIIHPMGITFDRVAQAAEDAWLRLPRDIRDRPAPG